jgi:myo-inositol-1(or 4)-monophosphatase
MEAKDLILSAIPLVREAGLFIRKEAQSFRQEETQLKSTNQLVSYVDVTAEKMLVEGLKRLTPSAGFITEENTVAENAGAGQVWVIDPLDGTTNFIHGVPVFSVSVGLMSGGRLSGGIVYEISRDECFYAWKGGGAWCNEKKISVSQTGRLEDALLATGFPYYDYGRLDGYMALLKEMMRQTRGLRRLGSAAVDLAYVACGRFDVFFEYSLSAWDVAAGALIVQEAGGKVCDFSGGDDFLFGKEIIASNPFLYGEFLGVARKKLEK